MLFFLMFALVPASLGASVSTEAITGIGVTLQRIEGYWVISSIIAGSPAAHDPQMEAGARVLAVAQQGEDFRPATPMTLSELTSLLRGSAGTEVLVHLALPGQSGAMAERVISLRRAPLRHLPQASPFKITTKIGGVRRSQVWDSQTDEGGRTTLTGHSAPVVALGFGWRLRSASEDGSVRWWAVSSPGGGYTSLAAQQVPIVASISSGAWAMAIPEKIRVVSPGRSHDIETERMPVALSVSDDGTRLLTAYAEGDLELFGLSTGAPRMLVQGRISGVPKAVALSPDGRRIAIGTAEGALRLLSTTDFQDIADLDGHPGGTASLSFCGAGRLVSGGADLTVRVHRLDKSRPTSLAIRMQERVRAVACTFDGAIVAIALEKDPRVLLFTGSGDLLAAWIAHDAPVSSLAFDQAGERIASGAEDGTISISRVPRKDSPAPVAPVFSGPPIEDLDQPPAMSTLPRADGVAVIVGIESYAASALPRAAYGKRDAETLQRYFVRLLGYEPENVLLLTDEKATMSGIRSALAWARNHAKDRGSMIFYFSGHGTFDPVSGESRLVPSDASLKYLETSTLLVHDLARQLGKLPVKDVFIILDSCFSGQGPRSLSRPDIKPLVPVPVSTPDFGRVVVLSAASAGQISTVSNKSQHGLLTHYLLKAFRGEADRDGDAELTTREMFVFAAAGVSRDARKENIEQTPSIVPSLSKMGDAAEFRWQGKP